MEKLKRVLLVVILLAATTESVFSQNVWVQALEGFNNLSESVGKLFDTFNATDNKINKEKTLKMASVLYAQVSDLKLSKEAVLLKLQSDASANLKLEKETNAMLSQLDKIQGTITEYKDLIEAAGIDAQKLSYGLRSDFLAKTNTLQDVQRTMRQGMTPEEVRQELIIHYTKCIDILKSTMDKLESFKA